MRIFEIEIMDAIEKMRKELVELVLIKGMKDPEVIILSQKLDKLIVSYYRLQGESQACG